MMRPKKRYLVVKIGGARLSSEQARHAIAEAVTATFGTQGLAEANVKLIAFDEGKQEAVIRCALAALDKVISALALCTKINSAPGSLRVVRVTGILARVKGSTQRI